ncbi:MAG TPA: FAD-dependent oxidoreductase [Polyangiaceae bacterium]|jgi:sarcosine oxidase subunit beta|nr:FAD-dependent oxidoreductase [Polyangiaceae bacterium]
MVRSARALVWPEKLRAGYDVVIIGGGGHGLAAAHYLARDHGIRDVVVLEAGTIGRGNSGRNTAIVRSNYLTPEGVRFYQQGVTLWEGLARELDIQLFYAQRGHLTLAHTEGTLRTMRWRAGINQHLGVDSDLVGPDEVARLCPALDLACGGHLPILGALYHPPGAIVAHDAVVWGYARSAMQAGVEVHPDTAVRGFDVRGGKVVGVETSRGYVGAGRVLCAVAGSTPRMTALLGLRTPLVVHPLQACISEPMQPWLDPIVVSASLHAYVSQDVRGTLVMGASLDGYELSQPRSTFGFLEEVSTAMLSLFPALGPVRIVRQWAGMADMTPDFSPLMGPTPIENFYLDAGWGTWGFKATPVAGRCMAHTVARGRAHPLIEPFGLDRFARYDLIGEKAAASVGH